MFGNVSLLDIKRNLSRRRIANGNFFLTLAVYVLFMLHYLLYDSFFRWKLIALKRVASLVKTSWPSLTLDPMTRSSSQTGELTWSPDFVSCFVDAMHSMTQLLVSFGWTTTVPNNFSLQRQDSWLFCKSSPKISSLLPNHVSQERILKYCFLDNLHGIRFE